MEEERSGRIQVLIVPACDVVTIKGGLCDDVTEKEAVCCGQV